MPDSAVGDLLGLASPDAPAPVATEESVKPERSATVRYLYHEPQLSSLCGVHALNNLLQGPYFGAGDLGEIAARVETREREILHDAALAERLRLGLRRAASAGLSYVSSMRERDPRSTGRVSRRDLRAVLAELGVQLNDDELGRIFARFGGGDAGGRVDYRQLANFCSGADKAAFNNRVARYIQIKEEQARATKDEILVLWTDFFKPANCGDDVAQVHNLFWNAAKQCSKAKQSSDPNEGLKLLVYMQQIHTLFWKVKGKDVPFYLASKVDAAAMSAAAAAL